jgi:hypothetical protein
MPYYVFLKDRGLNVWIDHKKLLGGQQWDYELRKALDQAVIIIMFVSENSVNRRGYVQREIRLALNKVEEKLISDIYIIPVLLDAEAIRPEQLASIQFLDVADVEFDDKLLEAINHQFQEVQAASIAWSKESGIYFSKSYVKDEWNGLPGYAFSGEIPNLSSQRYANLNDVTDVVRGYVKSNLLRQRAGIIDQSGSHFNFGDERTRRTNTWDAYCGDPIVRGRVLSLIYTIAWYGAGAAHPNTGYHTFNFLLDPLCEADELQAMMTKPDAALAVIQKSLFDELSQLKWADGDDEEPLLNHDTIRAGIEDWESLRNYVFTDDGIRFLFSPYQVGSYVAGPQSATVPYEAIAPFVRDIYRSALDIYYAEASPIIESDDFTRGDDGKAL